MYMHTWHIGEVIHGHTHVHTQAYTHMHIFYSNPIIFAYQDGS